MSRLVTAASALLLGATATAANAWYGAPYAPAPMTPEQHQAFAAQQQAFAERRAQAIEQAMEAQRRFMEQQAGAFAMPQQPPAFPERPAMPAFGAPPELPAMPAMPEIPGIADLPEPPAFGQRPTPPAYGQRHEMPAPAVDIETRRQALETYRTKMREAMEARRAAIEAMMSVYPQRAPLPATAPEQDTAAAAAAD
ncbi:hypothetical protein [Marichromatium bheemlicum]|uniref:Uncharacterized protein n=1 Tax=Marichromatium bheemlicum TaxID=365339 RepID=A0ABX1ICY7_9GAMM|nr:hypothetical protein [Marichromatium bheemlicum]NKN33951.1 hypothetical protein [Marichromatium bheemlicum]